MRHCVFVVTITAPDEETAQTVAAERLGYDEDHGGFDYTIDSWVLVASFQKP